VAIKVQKSASQYMEAAEDEIHLLGVVKEKEREAAKPSFVVQLYDHFIVHGPNGKHMSMCFEVMGENLLWLIKRYNYRGIPLPAVKIITLQALIGLDFLHARCGIIHTDIKPENFLLAPFEPLSPARVQRERREHIEKDRLRRLEKAKLKLDSTKLTKNQRKRLRAKLKKAEEDKLRHEQEIAQRRAAGLPVDEDKEPQRPPRGPDDPATLLCKISDLGNACWIDRHFTEDVTTRQYRAPEVIVGYPYTTAIDVWSLACMVFELVCGDYLFDPKEDTHRRHTRDEDHLALMIELLGKMPAHLLADGKLSNQYFNKKGELRNIKELDFWQLLDVLVQKYKMEPREAESLTSFLLPMLDMDPETRATAAEALQHPWLAETMEAYKRSGLKAFEVPWRLLNPPVDDAVAGADSNARASASAGARERDGDLDGDGDGDGDGGDDDEATASGDEAKAHRGALHHHQHAHHHHDEGDDEAERLAREEARLARYKTKDVAAAASEGKRSGATGVGKGADDEEYLRRLEQANLDEDEDANLNATAALAAGADLNDDEEAEEEEEEEEEEDDDAHAAGVSAVARPPAKAAGVAAAPAAAPAAAAAAAAPAAPAPIVAPVKSSNANDKRDAK
jgi:serine/threonine-protein kinase SRPK3